MSLLSSEAKEIADGVILHKEPEGDSSYIFSLEQSHLHSLSITCDFTNSENIYLSESSGLKTSALVHPFTKTKLCKVNLLDEWRISSKFTLKIVDAPKALIFEAMKKDRKDLSLKIENSRSVFSRLAVSLSPLGELEKVLKANNLNFVDVEFPPEDFLSKVNFVWKRLSSAYPSGKLLPESIEPFDLIMGDGKGFWLKSALEVLAERPECIRRLFVTKKVNNLGIYRVKICKNNQWRTVTVDDFIPFLPSGSCLLSTAVDRTFWPCLLEKAYCKMFSSYEVLNYNGFSEILQDFTGCPAQVLDLNDLQGLWEVVVKNSEKPFLFCLFNENDEKVPVAAVLKTFVVDERGLLLCRNLSEEEKKTRWHKNSKLWTNKIRSKVNPKFDLNSFFLEIDEISEYFNKLLICKLDNWFEFRDKSEFRRSEDVFCKSQVYYSISVEEKTRIVVTLQQEDERDLGVIHCRNYIDIGILLLQVDQSNSLQIVSFQDLVIEKSTSLDLDLDPGTFILLPFTSGCLLQAPSAISPEKSKIFLQSGPNPLFLSALNDIFNKLDTKNENVLTFEKFRIFNEKLGKNVNEGEFRQKVLKKFLSLNDGLTLEGFREFMVQQARTLNEEVLWDWLEFFGYDRDFYSIQTRLFFVSIHSDKEVDVDIRKNSQGFEDDICKYLISKNSIEFESDGQVKVVYYFSKAVHCYFYGVFNKGEEGIECTLDCTESENMAFYFKTAAATRFVGPGDLEYVMPAIALPAAENFYKAVRVFYKKQGESP